MFALIRLASRRARGLVLTGIGIGLASGFMNATLLAIAERTVQVASPTRASLLSFVALGLSVLVARFLSLLVMTRLPPQALHDLRLRLSEQVMATPIQRLEHIGVGGLQALLTQDVGTVVNGIAGLPPLIIAISAILAALGYVAWLTPTMFVGVVTVIGLTFLVRTLLDKRAVRAFIRAMEKQATLFGSLNDQVAGAKELHMSPPLRDSFRTLLRARSSDHAGAQATAMTRLSIGNIWVEGGFQVLIGGVVFAAPLFIGDMRHQLRVDCMMVCLFLYSQLQIVNIMVPTLRTASAALGRIEKLSLTLPPLEATPRLEPPVIVAPTELSLREVTTKYRSDKEGETFRLGPVSLTFRRGELSFIVGGNGSGKSTLAKVLCGLYSPDAGEVVLDGVAIGDHDRPSYRALVAAVFSDFHLFDVLPKGVDLARAGELLRTLQLDGKVRVIDGRFSSTALSQGQRKRLALLVAYLEDRPIYLFDEWAADQDPSYRETFYAQLLPELVARGKIVVVITHDDRYFSHADRIIKIESGVVVEDGRRGPKTDDAPLTA